MRASPIDCDRCGDAVTGWWHTKDGADLCWNCMVETQPAAVERALLRRVLSEYLAGNRIVDGYWYSPDETGAPHYRNEPATADEVALIESLRTEVGL